MFYLFLFAHIVADFVLQPMWLVERKKQWHGLFIHVGIVLACMLALGLLNAAIWALWPAMLGIGAVHLAADRWKVRCADALPYPPIVAFLLDQSIHLATVIGVLSLAVPQAQLWSFDIAFAHASLYATAYLIAAFATPIAVMIWLDPCFSYAALAGRARLHSIVASVVVVSLVLVAGVYALPLTLAGATIVAWRPLSAHPLDTPRGLLSVLAVATLLGALLVQVPTW